MTKNNMTEDLSWFTREQRRVIYSNASDYILERKQDFGCIALLMAAMHSDDEFCGDVNEQNFPEFFLFRDHDQDVWLGGGDFHPEKAAGRMLRYDVLVHLLRDVRRLVVFFSNFYFRTSNIIPIFTSH
jgi:hypothetical protein